MNNKTGDIILREASQADYDEILRLNEETVQFLSPMDMDRLKTLKKASDLLWVAEIGEAKSQGKIGAFVMCFREGADYDSVNYRWFEKNFKKFLYIDRIVVDIPARKDGLGNLIYDKVFEYGKKSGLEIITAEIDIKPENPISLKFHQKFGFKEVGRQEVAGGTKTVSLQAAKLTGL